METIQAYLTHPRDGEWLVYGLFWLGLWVSVVWQSWNLPGQQRKFLDRNPSLHNEINLAFNEYRTSRFSLLGNVLYGMSLSCGCLMIALAYVDDTYFAEIFLTQLYFLAVCCAVFGAHIIVNVRLFALVEALKTGKSEKYVFPLNEIKSRSAFLDRLVGAVFLATGLFLLSCLSVSWPYSLFELAQFMAQS